ncbi:flippase-like domain-containing protein [Weissella diestrammenae]|uniref:Phosphatidylglycerol lysyltransferase n=1 Tax=Weissella diestrammenae TaxID=1162633 RepID=A0A7G9T426_9LACO|nr:lysylphosphatidylglycerol synthase transmembrane domain-containing protein [Weissella diestrammenae]MCM0583051.1 flippase-like domain-containing protein [Weissella diestrammenae]QNN74851.1 flippase-like domain-containing protein [Weissella diestrammenae]
MTRKNSFIFVLMLLLGGGIFYFSMRHVDSKAFIQSIHTANWWWLLVALGAMIVYLLLEAVVVKIFVDTEHEKISWRAAIRVPLVEQLGNGITPFATGGQPMQMIALAQAGIDIGRSGSILLMKFVVYQGMIVINFVIALLIGFNYIADKLNQMALLVIIGFLIHFAVIVTLLLVMYWPAFTDRLTTLILAPVKWFNPKKHEQWLATTREKIDNFHAESYRMSRRWGAMGKAIGVTFVQLALYYAIPYFILLALGQTHASFIFVMSLHILIVMVISLFPIPGGAGGAEASFSMLFSSFLPNAATLVLAMLIWRLITYYFGMFAGIIAFNVSARKRTK